MKARADRWRWSRAGGARPSWNLVRRGVAHGVVTCKKIRHLSIQEAHERWVAAEPVHFRNVFARKLARNRPRIVRTLSLFERLRRGAEFETEVRRRCSGRVFEPAGASVDLGDEREIEKVHVDFRHQGRIRAHDLWGKLSWISLDPRDDSLRIRFSFGAERHDEWRTSVRRAVAADLFAEKVFPECRLLSRDRGLSRILEEWTGRSIRFSERIVFSNAPGGGAVFHHDAEPGQLGVAYAQLTGRTGWLALSKRALAAEVARVATRGALASSSGTAARALRTLERHDLPGLDRLLNRSPRFTRHLVDSGAFVMMCPGDVLLLPSHGPDDAAWHSVFALEVKPSLSLSFGVFAPRGGR